MQKINIFRRKRLKILVLSDSHGNVDGIKKVFETLKFDYLIFLGDGLRDLGNYIYLDNVMAVSGNCDYFSDEPIERLFNANGVLIFMTHGHKYSAKSGINLLKAKGREERADIVLFGHTHTPLIEKFEDIIIANPGTFQKRLNGMCQMLEINIDDNKKIDIKPIYINLN